MFKILRRLSVLCFLSACVVLLSTGWAQRALAATCESCDEQYVSCEHQCDYEHDICQVVYGPSYGCDLDDYYCYQDCKSAASNCWSGCTITDPTNTDTGSHSSACGRGRSPCELACNDALHGCDQNGGTDCGTNYNDCMNQCCE